MKNTIQILEYSACSNKQAMIKLKYSGNSDLRVVFGIKNMISEYDFDLISVRDIAYHTLVKLKKELAVLGYIMYIHPEFKSQKDKYRYTCLSALFIKKEINFEQIFGDEQFETIFRYISGKLDLAGNEIIYKTGHAPCVDDSRPGLSKQIKRKEDYLSAEVEFQNKYRNVLALSSGDFNGAGDADCYCQELYEKFCFEDLIHEKTYEEQRLDHCYISPAMKESNNINVTAEVLDDYYMQLTDHKMIKIVMSTD